MPEVTKTYTIEEGFYVDSDGVVVALADFMNDAPDHETIDLVPFRPDTPEKALWVLGKLRDKEAALAGAEAEKKALTTSVNVNCGPRINRLKAGVEWLRSAYKNDLELVALSEVAKLNAGKPESKHVGSWRTAFGLLAFVADNKGKIEARADEDHAARALGEALGQDLSACKPGDIVRVSVVIKDIPQEALAHILNSYFANLGITDTGDQYEVKYVLDVDGAEPAKKAAAFQLLTEGVKTTEGDTVTIQRWTHADLFDVTPPGTKRFDIRTGAK